jgi:outer membrane protein
MSNKRFSVALAATLLAGTSFAAEGAIGVVNFSTCVTDSKHGKKEQENFESLRKQMASMIENVEAQLKEIATKANDVEYRDSLSPQAEQELQAQFQSLQEELGRYQNQFYQVLNHANHQMVAKITQSIGSASKPIAEKNGFAYILNKEACFYIRSDLDVTDQVISEMNKRYEHESKRVSENEELSNMDNDPLNRAG